MKNAFKNELQTYCTLHWWNMGKKTLEFKGQLEVLLKEKKITYKIYNTDIEGVYKYSFKSAYGISFITTGVKQDFAHVAKQFIQMELVRMGDKAQLYVNDVWRHTVNVNF